MCIDIIEKLRELLSKNLVYNISLTQRDDKSPCIRDPYYFVMALTRGNFQPETFQLHELFYLTVLVSRANLMLGVSNINGVEITTAIHITNVDELLQEFTPCPPERDDFAQFYIDQFYADFKIGQTYLRPSPESVIREDFPSKFAITTSKDTQYNLTDFKVDRGFTLVCIPD